MLKERTYSEQREDYARAEISRLEALLASEEAEALPSIQKAIQSQYSNLAQALYEQTRLTEAREAARQGLDGWRDAYEQFLESMQKALNCIDGDLCDCMEGAPYYQRFSIQQYGIYTILQCPQCGERFALTNPPEQIRKINSGRVDLAKNKETSKSIPDEAL